jgi:hypothetical protein
MDMVGYSGIKRKRFIHPNVKKTAKKSGGEFSVAIIKRSKKELNTNVSESTDDDGLVQRDPTFLPSFLQFEVPIRNHLLPHLDATDFESLEKVNQACLCAIPQKGYWKDIIHKTMHEKREKHVISSKDTKST